MGMRPIGRSVGAWGVARLTLPILTLLAGCHGGCGGGQRQAPDLSTSAREGTALLLTRRALDGSGAGLDPGSTAQGTGEGTGDDPVVAWVNTVFIHRSDLERALRRRLGAMGGSQAERTPAFRNRERRRVVTQLVEEEMLRQDMAQEDISVSDDEVEQALTAEIDRVFHSNSHFEQYLARRHMTPADYREQLRFNMQLERLLATRGPAQVTDDQVRDYYDHYRENWHAPERVQASTITMRLSRDASNDQVAAAVADLNALRQSIVAGDAAFGETAREHSQSPDRYRDGDMGWVYRDDPDLDPHVAQVLFGMAVGQISEPVRTLLGEQIFWVRDHRAEGYREFDEVRDSLQQVVAQREQQALRAALIHELEQRFEVGYNEGAFGLEPE